MTVLLSENFEGGTAGGSCSTGGTSFNSFTASGGFPEYTSTAAHGSLAMQCTNAGANRAIWSGLSLTEHYGEAYIYLPSAPTTARPFAEMLNSSGGFLALQVNTSLQVDYIDNGSTNPFGSGSQLTANAWYRVEWHVVPSPGSLQVRIYALDSTTALYDSGVKTLVSFTGYTSITEYLYGAVSGAGMSINMDDIRIGDSTGGWLGPANTTYTGTAAILATASVTAAGDLLSTANALVTASVSATAGLTGVASAAINATASVTAGPTATMPTSTGITATASVGAASSVSTPVNITATAEVDTNATKGPAGAAQITAVSKVKIIGPLPGPRDIELDYLLGTSPWDIDAADTDRWATSQPPNADRYAITTGAP